MISYAQNFEDVMLTRLFSGRKSGFYVDVGAADPINLSVTKWFYELGWSGINIEPNRQLFERLAADRPRDINLECGVGSAAREALFFEPDVGELSSFDVRVQENAAADGRKGSTRSVSVVTLTSLLDRHCGGRPIDFLKIDVEGWEYEAVKGLDLQIYRPIVLVVEATLPESQTESHMDWEPLLLKGNYTFVYFDGVNRFYLANEHLALQHHFNRPPNVFDDFRTHALVTAEFDAKQRLENVAILQALHDDVKRNLDTASEKLNESNRTLLQVSEENKQLKTEYNELNAAHTELNAVNSELSTAYIEINGTNTKLNNSHIKLDTAHTELHAACSKLNAVNAELSAAHAKLNAEHAELTAEHAELTAEYAKLNSSHTKLNAAHTELNAAHEGLNAAHEDLGIRYDQILRSSFREFFIRTFFRKNH